MNNLDFKFTIRFVAGLLLVFVAGCMPSTSEFEQAYADEPFPVEMVAEVELSDGSSSNRRQIVYCFYDQNVDPLYRRQKMKVLSLDISAIFDVDQSLWTGPFGVDLGCVQGFAWSPTGNELVLGLGGLNGFVSVGIASPGNQISEKEFFDLPQYTYYERPHFPSWSPDGQWLAFISDQSRTFPSVYLASGDGTQVSQLTNSFTLPGVVSEPVWSHDGTKIAYVLPIPDNGIGIIEVATGVITEYSQNTVTLFSPGSDHPHGILPKRSIAWLPGDNLLLFLTNSESADKDILWVMAADGSNLRPLYEAPIKQITLSPDGKMLAMIVTNDKRAHIQLLHLEQNPRMQTILDGANWKLTDNKATMFSDLDWSPDGSELVFAANPSGNFDLFLWDKESEAVTQITNTPADETLPRWRPYPLSAGEVN